MLKLKVDDRVLITDPQHPFHGEIGYVVGFGTKSPVKGVPRVRLPEIMDHEVYVQRPGSLKKIGS